MDAGTGERGFVHESGDSYFRREAVEGLAGGGQEEGRGAADASAKDDDVWGEGCCVDVEGMAEMAAKAVEGPPGATVGGIWVGGIGGGRPG